MILYSNIKLNTILSSFLVLLCFSGSTLFSQNAAITEEYQEFKTYPYSDPNPVADAGKIYPYFRFDGYSTEGKPKKWKVVTLENEYIKVFVTPEIGGKIWGAMEKASGKMFIYNNEVVKFRNIAMRGPWTSGGIESNFGIIGHAPTGSSPIDYILQNNEDGSVSCVIGALDLITGTTWRVEIRLPKDKAFFETNVLWHNNTALNQPYYQWMTGAARASDDLQFFFPGDAYIGHGGQSNPWPNHENGHDISLYAENDFGPYKSYHILGEYADFFGGYYYNDHLGFGNWSTYTDKPGKKLWIWGLSRQGMVWENLLTDTNGQYIEMQTGRLFNQAAESSTLSPFKHREFPAYATDTWSEIWFPVKETEGMKSANKFGVLNVEPLKDKFKIYFSPLQHIDDEIIVKVGDKIIYNKHVKLKPLEIFIDSFSQKSDKNIQVTIGQNKLTYSSEDPKKNALNRPLESPDNFDWNSVQGFAIKGKEAAKQLDFVTAMDSYEKCLGKDPNYIAALTGMAELYYHKMNYETALNYAKRALAVDTYHGAANYIYGVINGQLNLIVDAKDGFSIAAHSIEFRSAAYTQMAKMEAKEHAWVQAEDYAKRALEFNTFNISAHEVLISSQRKQKRNSTTEKSINLLLEIDPLNHYARFENYLMHQDKTALQEFKHLIRNELPQETYLDLAIKYYNTGMEEAALLVLENAPKSSIVNYWMAYFNDQFDNTSKSMELLKEAEDMSSHLVFPFRKETLEVLNWSTKQRSHWKTNYYLALVYWKKGHLEKALELFTQCKNESAIASFYLSRAKIFRKTAISKSLVDVQFALKLDKNNWRALMQLASIYSEMDEYEKSFNAIKTLYKQDPNDYRFAVPYARGLLRVEDYKKCISILENIEVLPFEGASGGRTLLRNAHILSAIQDMEKNKSQKALVHVEKARLWPENLGAGKPYNSDELLEDYLEMKLSNGMNQPEESVQLLQKIKGNLKENKSNGNNTIIVALLLREEGKYEEANELLKSWNEENSNNDLAKWSLAVFNKDMSTADLLLEKIKDNPSIRIYIKTVHLSN